MNHDIPAYLRLAHREEWEVATEFGDAWREYAVRTPSWFPRLMGQAREARSGEQV